MAQDDIQNQQDKYEDHKTTLDTCKSEINRTLSKYINDRTSSTKPPFPPYLEVIHNDKKYYVICGPFEDINITAERVKKILFHQDEIEKIVGKEDTTAIGFIESIEAQIKAALIGQNQISLGANKSQFFTSITTRSSSQAIAALQDCITQTNYVRKVLGQPENKFADVKPPVDKSNTCCLQ